jgi:hypothetical protein
MDDTKLTRLPTLAACAAALCLAFALACPGLAAADAGAADAPTTAAAREDDARSAEWTNPRTPQDVPVGHWSYPLLARLVARGAIYVDLSTLPVSRAAVAQALVDAMGKKKPSASVTDGMSEREVWTFKRLVAEFLHGEVDVPALFAESDEAMVGLGFQAMSQLRYGPEVEVFDLWPGTIPGGPTSMRDGDDGEGHGDGDEDGRGDEDDETLDVAVEVRYDLWGGVRDLVGFYSDAWFLFGGQEGARTVRLTPRVRTWRGVATSVERAYFILERPWFAVAAGRRDPAWGRARWGRLAISGAAPTFDQIDGRFLVGALSFHALHAFVEYDALPGEDFPEWEQMYLAAHRLSFDGAWGSVGFSETVIYSGTTPDPVYVIPIFPYYLMQHNERENDNILWSLDLLYRPVRGLDLYGEFLIDDLQYDRNTDHPDKYGVTLGAAWFGEAAGRDYALTAEYTSVRKYTYTATRLGYRFEHAGMPTGFALGPDSDLLTLEGVWHATHEWSAGVTYRHSRKGEGRVTDRFVAGMDPAPSFPSGVVWTTDRLSLEVGYEDLRGVFAGFGLAWQSVENRENVLGEDRDGWELWAGVQVRI